MLSNVNKD